LIFDDLGLSTYTFWGNKKDFLKWGGGEVKYFFEKIYTLGLIFPDV